MKKLLLGSILFSLFLVGCSSAQPEETVVEDYVIEEVVIVSEPVEAPTQPLPKPLLDK